MFAQLHVWSLYLLQEAGGVGWDPISLWHQMGWPAKTVVVILFFMSAYSIGVMIDRLLAYNGARKQSRLFAPAVAGARAAPSKISSPNCASRARGRRSPARTAPATARVPKAPAPAGTAARARARTWRRRWT